jgi:hypothetical protein
MSQAAFALLEKSLAPVSEHMTHEAAREVLQLRATPDVQSRIDQLADKCNEGQLTPDERSEYEMFVWAGQYISSLQLKARKLLANA